MTATADDVREEVRRRYAEAAIAAGSGAAEPSGCGCGPSSCCGEEHAFGETLYSDEERAALPRAVASSLGCGNPVRVAELRPGETVLDLGSGGGLDVILSAKRVGRSGIVYGVDMTDEMLALARANADEAGVRNAHFLKGRIEELPLPAASVDVVVSNCVINLSTDKPAVLAEIGRVLRPGGRIGVSDVVAEDRLTETERGERGSWVGCIAGALSVSEYRAGLEAAGLVDVELELTAEVADGIHQAIVRARKPGTQAPPAEAAEACCGSECCG